MWRPTSRRPRSPSCAMPSALLASFPRSRWRAARAGACAVLSPPCVRRYQALAVAAAARVAARAALLIPAALDDLTPAPAHLSASAWGAIVFIGLSSGSFYVLWLWALKNIAA